MAPQWWAVVLMLLACAFVVLVGASMWFQASAAEWATARLRGTGRLADLAVVAVRTRVGTSPEFGCIVRVQRHVTTAGQASPSSARDGLR